jgi:hypothetical protein
MSEMSSSRLLIWWERLLRHFESERLMGKTMTDSFRQLEGKKIVKVNPHGLNAVSFETEDGKYFMAETECALPTLQLYGVRLTEVTKESIHGKE